MSDGALWLMAIAVAVSSVSLLIIAVAEVSIFRLVRKLSDDVAPLVPQVQETLKNFKQALETSFTEVRSLAEQGRGLIRDTKEQIQYIDAARADLTHVKIHGQRFQLVTEDILGRAQEVAGVLHNSVIRPVREVSLIVAVVRAVIQTFLVGRRT